MIRYFDDAIRALVLILPKVSRYVKTFKDKNNKLMSSQIDDEKYESIWTKTEDLKSIELNASPVYNDRYIKIKIRKIRRMMI